MSFVDWFAFKSKKQREAEQRKFQRFSFPYGDEQKKCIERLLGELMPKEPAKTAMAIYLLGREGYHGSFKMDAEDRAERTEDESMRGALYVLSNQLKGRYRKYLPYYLALILADSRVDEDLQYPDAASLLKEAESLKESLKL